jgi:hypothetical protein
MKLQLFKVPTIYLLLLLLYDTSQIIILYKLVKSIKWHKTVEKSKRKSSRVSGMLTEFIFKYRNEFNEKVTSSGRPFVLTLPFLTTLYMRGVVSTIVFFLFFCFFQSLILINVPIYIPLYHLSFRPPTYYYIVTIYIYEYIHSL